MTFWPIILILLAVAMTVGPIMLMQPSGKERRLASLRQEAALSGLHVRMTDYEINGATTSVAVYSYQVKLPKKTPFWTLVRRSYEHEIHFHSTWEWQSLKNKINAQKVEQLHKFIDSLPDDFVGIAVNESMVALWWRERSSQMTIKKLKELLQELAAIAS